MLSEKDMEDQIADNPEKFLEERSLRLLARQYSIGSYRFDLLFEDRHGGKLIVEIQKGTLDRDHTYKILDYYDEYRLANPRDHIDVLVVANQIPVERKRRLQDRGIAFVEIPVERFLQSEIQHVSQRQHAVVTPAQDFDPHFVDQRESGEPPRQAGRTPSLGHSAFMETLHRMLATRVDQGRWQLKGQNCLQARFMPVHNLVEKLHGRGLRAHGWMERPIRKFAACKFEIAGEIKGLEKALSQSKREAIADSIRRFVLKRAIAAGYKGASGSTIVRCDVKLPGIQEPCDDTPDKASHYQREIERIVGFIEFLDTELLGWLASQRH
jgi:hypothetical protein